MTGAGFPGFGGMQPRRAPEVVVPHSHPCGDVAVPWNVGATIFRFRAPVAVTLKNITLYCASVSSPSGASVVIEAWKNGQYGGETIIVNGPNSFDSALPLSPMDLIELRACVKGTGDCETKINDFWVMFAT
jgi:hypothetical protein